MAENTRECPNSFSPLAPSYEPTMTAVSKQESALFSDEVTLKLKNTIDSREVIRTASTDKQVLSHIIIMEFI